MGEGGPSIMYMTKGSKSENLAIPYMLSLLSLFRAYLYSGSMPSSL